MKKFLLFTSILSMSISTQADVVARITRLEGTVSIMRSGFAEWRAAKPSTPLEVETRYIREKKVCGNPYSIGTVLRMDEKTKITIASLPSRP